MPLATTVFITARRLFTLNTRQNILTDIHINYNKKGNSYRIIISTDFSANELPFLLLLPLLPFFNYASFLYILFCRNCPLEAFHPPKLDLVSVKEHLNICYFVFGITACYYCYKSCAFRYCLLCNCGFLLYHYFSQVLKPSSTFALT